MIYCTSLSNRGILKISGSDRLSFLQGLVTNDLTKLNKQRSLYSLLLTPQGKHSFDLFITEVGNEWWLEADKNRLEELKKRLSLFKLRSDITLEIGKNETIYCIWGEGAASAFEIPLEHGYTHHTNLWHVFIDPRLEKLGVRMIVSQEHIDGVKNCEGFTFVEEKAYQSFRYDLGIPESNQELWVDKSIPLENGMDELDAINWEKGCYMGQELTARTRYRGLVRKRLLPVTFKGTMHLDSPLMQGDLEVGSWRGLMENKGLALIRLEALGKPITCEGIEVVPHIPEWMKLPE